MGPAISSNLVDTAVDINQTIVNSTLNTCKQGIDQSQIFNIRDNTGTTINIGDLELTQLVQLQIGCMAQSSTSSAESSNVSDAIKQTSTAINQALSLNPGSTTASNVILFSAEIGEQVLNEFSQTCTQDVFQNQSLFIEDNTNVTVNATVINLSQSANAIMNCVQNSQAVNDLKSQLSLQISQTATAEVKGFLGQLVLILALIVVLVVTITFGSTVKIIIVIIVIAVILVIMGLIFGWFKKGGNDPNKGVDMYLQYSIDGGNTYIQVQQPSRDPKTGLITYTQVAVGVPMKFQTWAIDHSDHDTANPPIKQNAINSAQINLNTVTNNMAQTTSTSQIYEYDWTSTPGQINVGTVGTDASGGTHSSYILPLQVMPPLYFTEADNVPLNSSQFDGGDATSVTSITFGGTVTAATADKLTGATVKLHQVKPGGTPDITISNLTASGTQATFTETVALHPGNYNYQFLLYDAQNNLMDTSNNINFTVCTCACGSIVNKDGSCSGP